MSQTSKDTLIVPVIDWSRLLEDMQSHQFHFLNFINAEETRLFQSSFH